jgi:raffinose/stachyose/melibiose transport system substrate-binding protein
MVKAKKKGTVRLAAVTAIVFALIASPFATVNAAENPSLGKKCSDEGINTGTTSRSLICVKNTNGELRWARVKLSSSGGQPVAQLKAQAGSIEFHHWRGEDKTVFDTLIAKFEQANPGVKVTQVIKDSTSYQANALTVIRNNPKAAVFTTFRGGQFNDFSKAGMLLDITDQRFVKNNVIQSALAPATVGGRVYGIPYQSLFNNPLYNAEMFAKKGWKVPKNWTQLLAFCKTAKADGIIPMAWPAATRGNAGQIINSFLMNSAPNLETLEQRVIEIESGKTDLTSAWFKDIANKYKQMADAGCFPNNVTGYNDSVAPVDFALGKAAIYPTGSFGISSVTKANPEMKGKIKMMSMITVDEKPLYEGITNNTFILSVNPKSTSRDQQIARAFISYLAQSKVAQEYAIGTSQHVSIVNVDYSANIDLLNVSDIMGKKLLLAPRFLFLNVAQVRDPMEDALIAIGGGADVNKTLTDTSAKIKQNLGK